MKKQYLFMLGLAMAGLTANAQNLVENGGFENWTAANPVNFNASTFGTNPPIPVNDLLVKETSAALVHNGTNSCRQASKPQGTTQYLEAGQWINVTVGNSYTFSYWYLDNSTSAKTRPWATWLTTGNQAVPDTSGDQHLIQNLQEEAYSTTNPNWVLKTITKTAPTGAAKVRIQVRTYSEGANNGGFIYFDEVSFVDNTTAGVNDNAITGLSLFPNPANGGIVYIASANDVAKSVAVFDILGKQVINTTVSNNGTIDVSALTSGVYMVKVTEEGKTATKKLVVQ